MHGKVFFFVLVILVFFSFFWTVFLSDQRRSSLLYIATWLRLPVRQCNASPDKIAISLCRLEKRRDFFFSLSLTDGFFLMTPYHYRRRAEHMQFFPCDRPKYSWLPSPTDVVVLSTKLQLSLSPTELLMAPYVHITSTHVDRVQFHFFVVTGEIIIVFLEDDRVMPNDDSPRPFRLLSIPLPQPSCGR